MRQSIKVGEKLSKIHIIVSQREITLPLSSWKKKIPFLSSLPSKYSNMPQLPVVYFIYCLR